MAKNENPETPEVDRKLSKSMKHPVLTVYHFSKTAKKAIDLLSKYHLGFNYQKSRFQTIIVNAHR